MLNRNLSKNAQAFINILADLSEKDTIILIERFVRKKSMKQVAKQLGLTDARIKDIEDKLINDIDRIFDYISLK